MEGPTISRPSRSRNLASCIKPNHFLTSAALTGSAGLYSSKNSSCCRCIISRNFCALEISDRTDGRFWDFGVTYLLLPAVGHLATQGVVRNCFLHPPRKPRAIPAALIPPRPNAIHQVCGEICPPLRKQLGHKLPTDVAPGVGLQVGAAQGCPDQRSRNLHHVAPLAQIDLCLVVEKALALLLLVVGLVRPQHALQEALPEPAGTEVGVANSAGLRSQQSFRWPPLVFQDHGA